MKMINTLEKMKMINTLEQMKMINTLGQMKTFVELMNRLFRKEIIFP